MSGKVWVHSLRLRTNQCFINIFLNVGKKGGRKETRERKSSQVWAAVSFGSSVEEVGW